MTPGIHSLSPDMTAQHPFSPRQAFLGHLRSCYIHLPSCDLPCAILPFAISRVQDAATIHQSTNPPIHQSTSPSPLFAPIRPYSLQKNGTPEHPIRSDQI